MNGLNRLNSRQSLVSSETVEQDNPQQCQRSLSTGAAAAQEEAVDTFAPSLPTHMSVYGPGWAELWQAGLRGPTIRIATDTIDTIVKQYSRPVMAAKNGFREAAGLLCVAGGKDTPRVLLLKRSALAGRGHRWAHAGGTADVSDFNLLHTALRESLEEMGDGINGKLVVDPLIYEDRRKKFRFITYVIFLNDGHFEPSLNWENCDWAWEPVSHRRIWATLLDSTRALLETFVKSTDMPMEVTPHRPPSPPPLKSVLVPPQTTTNIAVSLASKLHVQPSELPACTAELMFLNDHEQRYDFLANLLTEPELRDEFWGTRSP